MFVQTKFSVSNGRAFYAGAEPTTLEQAHQGQKDRCDVKAVNHALDGVVAFASALAKLDNGAKDLNSTADLVVVTNTAVPGIEASSVGAAVKFRATAEPSSLLPTVLTMDLEQYSPDTGQTQWTFQKQADQSEVLTVTNARTKYADIDSYTLSADGKS